MKIGRKLGILDAFDLLKPFFPSIIRALEPKALGALLFFPVFLLGRLQPKAVGALLFLNEFLLGRLRGAVGVLLFLPILFFFLLGRLERSSLRPIVFVIILIILITSF